MKKVFYIISFLLILNYFTLGNLFSSENKKLRIISLAPSATEILFSLGLDEEIIGVSTFCNYPPAALKKAKVGTFSQPDIEKIISLKPDIILATGIEQVSIVERLRQLKLNVFVCDPYSIEELLNTIKEIGVITKKENEAKVLIAKIEDKINLIKNKVDLMPLEKKPTVFVEIWHDPLMTAGVGSFVNELITLAGGINIAYDTPRPYSYFSAEQVIKRNPDCIILCYMVEEATISHVKKRFGWKNIAAVKNNRIYSDINPDLFLRPGPRLVDGLEQIHNSLFPDEHNAN